MEKCEGRATQMAFTKKNNVICLSLKFFTSKSVFTFLRKKLILDSFKETDLQKTLCL